MPSSANTPLASTAYACLSDRLRTHYGAGCVVESIEPKWRRSPSGHPLYTVRLQGPAVPPVATLHFRQSTATAENELRSLSNARGRNLRVPDVVLADTTTDNPFGAPFILREFVDGVALWATSESLVEHWDAIVATLLRLHEPCDGSIGPPSLSRLLTQQRSCAPLGRVPGFDMDLLGRRFAQVIALAFDAAEALWVPRTCELNNELHRSRMFLTPQGEVCIVNWDHGTSGDVCADLALLRIAVEELLGLEVERLQADFLARYARLYDAEMIDVRFAYHTAERYLSLIAHSCSPVLMLDAARRYFDRLNAFCGTPAAARLIA
jgi:aminoglycoside phosphotransferase (APT) family kinase protein